MRPSAAILRCRNLQLLGHSAKRFPITIRSENYTVEHFLTDCSNPTLCVNYHFIITDKELIILFPIDLQILTVHSTRRPFRKIWIGWILFFHHHINILSVLVRILGAHLIIHARFLPYIPHFLAESYSTSYCSYHHSFTTHTQMLLRCINSCCTSKERFRLWVSSVFVRFNY